MKLTLLTDPALRRRVIKGLAITLGVLVVFSLVAVYTYKMALGIILPPRQLDALKKETSALEQDVRRKERTKAKLQEKLDWWKTPEGQLELAHTRGLVKPGEHATVMLPPPGAATNEAPAAPVHRPLHLALLTLMVAACLGVVGGGVAFWRRRKPAGTEERPAGGLRTRRELLRMTRRAPKA